MSDDLTVRGKHGGSDRLLEHALAAALFVVADPVAAAARASARPASGCCSPAFALTALLGLARRDRASAARLPTYAETARNLVWVGVLHSLSARAARMARASAASAWSMARSPRCSACSWSVDALPIAARRSQSTGAIALHREHPAHHRRGRRPGPRPQSLRPGGAGQPHRHPLRHARAGDHLDLRPQPLHARLSRPGVGARPVRLARRGGRA